MNRDRWARWFALSLLTVLLSATLQSCGMIDIFARAIARVCEMPLEVTTTIDKNDGACLPDDCSLREAVVTANDCEGKQTIRVPAGTYNLTLTGAGEDDAETGDLDLKGVVRIEGTGDVVIDGNAADRVFQIWNDAFADGEAYELSNLRIQNGRVEDRGGGIWTEAREVILNDVVVQDSQAGVAGTSPGAGGGIFSNSNLHATGTLSLLNNTAYGQGGGIFVNGWSLEAPDAVIRGNRALDSYGGGGIYNRFGHVTVAGEISGNSASWAGGGVHNGWLMEIEGGEVSDNQATGPGGGISTTGTLTVHSTTISGNRAPSGGGLFAYVSDASGTAARTSLVDSTFSDNHADQRGGGIFNSGSSLLLAARTDLIGNDAASGGGIYNDGEATFLEAAIRGNRGNGAGVVSTGLTSLTRSTLAENHDTASSTTLGGSAIYSRDGGHVHLLNTTLSGNTGAIEFGGTITMAFGSVAADHVTIADNAVPAFNGRIADINALDLTNSIVAGNMPFDCNRPIASLGGNVFEDGSCGPTAYDFVGIGAGSAGLDPLAMNGGRTMTHALQSSSPAVDFAIGDDCPATDERGVPRPVGDGCDSGAFEVEDITPMSGRLPEGVPTGPTTCRFGPRPIYPPISYLSEGQTVQLLHRNEEGTWVEVQSVDGLVGPCWVDKDLLDIPPLVDVLDLDLGFIPPEPTLKPTPKPESSGGGGQPQGCIVDEGNGPYCQIPCMDPQQYPQTCS
ncbi:MAG: CSLREA domain-containing protein [Anaerolineales bacterium]